MISLAQVPRKSFTWTLVASVYFIICMYLVSVANSRSDDLNPNSVEPVYRRQVLMDPMMKWIQYWFSSGVIKISSSSIAAVNEISIELDGHKLMDIPTNVPDIFIAVSLLAWILRLSTMPSLIMGLALLRRTFWIAGTAYLLRAACVLMTILPFPYVECDIDKQDGTNSWIDAFNIMFMKRSSCGDVFYSGHTIVYSIACLSWITYAVQARSTCLRYSVALLILIETALACISLLAVAYHYSIDIIVSLFICCTLWLLYHTALRIYDTHYDHLIRLEPSDNSHQYLREALSSSDIIVDIDDNDQDESDNSTLSLSSSNQVIMETCSNDIKRIYGSWVLFISTIDGK